MQLSYIVLDCPVCGRPVEIRNQYRDRELGCDHCGGRFVVYENEDGNPMAIAHRKHRLIERADQLLSTTAFETSCVGSVCPPRNFSITESTSTSKAQSVSRAKPEEDHCDAAQRQPTALLVEHRDEVYARIATDMAETGMHVIRAKSAVEALKLFGRCAPTHVVANLDLPDQSGWLLACKLRFCQPDIQVWLYQADSSSYSGTMAKYLQINEVLNYGGDLLGLSETIVEMIAAGRMLFTEECDANDVEKAAAQRFTHSTSSQ